MNLDFFLTEPQIKFMQLSTPIRGFIAGYGAGKSEALVLTLISDLLTYKKAKFAVYLPTYDLLRLVIAPRIQEKLDLIGMEYEYKQQRGIIIVKGYGEIILRSLDNPARLVGFEVFRSYVDELDTLPLEKAETSFQMILARNRQKINGGTNQINIFSTPEGYRFCYKLFEQNKKDDVSYIQAPSYSNPFLPQDYISNLRKSYPDQLIQAYCDGKFVNLAFGTVYKSFDEVWNNTTRSYKNERVIYVGMDFNVGNMSAIIAITDDNKTFYVVDETTAEDTPQMAKKLKNMYPNCRIQCYPDASGQSRKSVNANNTDFVILQQAGLFTYADAQNPRVRDRVATVNAAFCNGDGERRLYVNKETCPKLTQSLLQQSYDKHGDPSKTTGHDHFNDALGYFVMKNVGLVSKVTNVKFKFA